MGCLEFIRLIHEEKLKLVRDLINANVTEPSSIVAIIKHLVIEGNLSSNIQEY